MANREVLIEVDMGKYKSVELSVEEAEKLLSKITETLGFESNDVNETFRILRNFDVFYDTMRKKFKDYLAPSKSMNDMIRGTVVVDRLRLIKEGDTRKVRIVFDRRISEDLLMEVLSELGYKVSIKKLKF
ncbi:MAG: hypothetical protein F7C81_05685 [Desulfurococcales archaeon]|nr:hypothetical protein [Desulfurococcales archaeon]